MEETEKIWMNGELIDWADAKVHVGVHGLHYGTGVFEGIRCYETPKGPAVFRLADHMQRLHDSARLLYMELPFSVEELREATHDLVRANGLPACYLRPIAFYGYGQLASILRARYADPRIRSVTKTDGHTWKVKEIIQRAEHVVEQSEHAAANSQS